jgi:hypothetical protein
MSYESDTPLNANNWTATGLADTDMGNTYSIEGGFGLRVASAGGAVSKYHEKMLTPTDSQGWRVRERIITRPTSGTLRLSAIIGEGDKTLGYFYIDSLGDLYAQSVNIAGVLSPAKKLYSAIANGSIVTLEMVAAGAGTTAGSIAYWVQVGGSGAPSMRSLYHIDSGLDWTGVLLWKLRAGGMSATAAFTLDVDALVRTESGEVQFIETDELGQEIYQANLYYAPGSPQRDDRYANGWRDVVAPGGLYTAGIDHEHAMVPDNAPAFPYTITAYDAFGRAYPLGSVLQDTFPDGITGTAEWGTYSHTYQIPEVFDDDGTLIGCFEVRMTSPGVSEGEYTCQRWSWSPGEEAIKEVRFAEASTYHGIYDTTTPGPVFGQYAETVWLAMGNAADVPEGTSLEVEYGSSEEPLPLETMASDPTTVEQNTYAQVRLTMTSDETRRIAPVVNSGSPFVDSFVYLRDQQAPAFLRADLSEFPGGAFAILTGFPREVSEYEVQRPRGRYSNTPLYPPVMEMPGYTLVAYTEEAFTEIEQTINEPEGFVIEAFDRRIVVAHGETAAFGFTWTEEEGMTRLGDGRFIGRGEAQVAGPVDVLSVVPMKGLVGLTRIPEPLG